MRIRLQEIILDGIKDMRTDAFNCKCGWTSHYNDAYMELLKSNRLWPLQMLDITVSQAIEKIEQMNDPAAPPGWTSCGSRQHTNIDYRNRNSLRLNSLKRANGLCIDCIWSSTTDTKHICRVQH